MVTDNLLEKMMVFGDLSATDVFATHHFDLFH